MAELEDTLRDIVIEVGELDDPAAVTLTANLFKDLGLDSMQALEIVLEIEQRLGIKVPEARLREIRTLADAVRVARELGAK